MTRPEFLRGYLLLTTQPWGKAYRTTAMSTAEPSPSEIQVEFYYQQLQKYDAEAWLQTCEQCAKGESWPSLDALKFSLKQYLPKHPQLPAPPTEPYLSKEEFGVDLFEAIKLQSSIRQAERLIKVYAKKERTHEAEAMEKQLPALHRSLKSILDRNTIAPADLTRLLAIT